MADKPGLFECLTGIHVDWMGLLFGLSVVWAIYVLYRVQRGTAKVDFTDWWVGNDGKASWLKAAGIFAFGVNAFILIYVTIIGKIPDGLIMLVLIFAAIYTGSPVALAIVDRWLGRSPQPLPLPPLTVSTVTEPSGTTTTTTTPGASP